MTVTYIKSKVMPLIPEDEPAMFSRSITVKFIKNQYFPILLPILALFLCAGLLYLHVWLTGVIYKEKVVSVVPTTFVRVAKAAEVEPKEMTTTQYICYKFGKECKVALAVAKAESGMRCDAQNVNKNGSVDAGLWQINSIHLKKGWKLTDLLDCKKATDFAYELYKAQGFQPWVAFWSGSYKKFLN